MSTTGNQNAISFPLDQMRENSRQISSLSQNLEQMVRAEWKKGLDSLTDVPAPIKAILEVVFTQLEKDIFHLINEHSSLAQNLARAADVAEMLDKDVSQGFSASI
jgi:hypothetical protein